MTATRRYTPARIFALTLLLAGMFFLATSRPAQASTVDVSISNYTYTPASLTVAVGTKVTWTNKDTVAHTVTSMSGTTLNSPLIQPGHSWSYTFTKAGTDRYYCAVHPQMIGSITVTSSSGSGGGTGAGGGTTSPPGTGSCTNENLFTALETPFLQHLDSAHLQASPSQQVAAILNPDQYVQTHTVLVENMAQPLFGLLEAAPTAMDPFIAHVNTAHLQASPADQVAAILNVSQYVDTHTILVQDMLNPITQSITGTYGC